MVVEWYYINPFIYSATVAQEYGKFWVGIESVPIEVVERDGNSGPTISTTRAPVTSTTPVYHAPAQVKVSNFV